MAIDRSLDRSGIELNTPRGLGDSPFGGPTFDSDMEALLPDIWFKFDQADYNTSVVSSGVLANADMTLQTSTAASVGAAMRSKTRNDCIVMPAYAYANWATEGAHYTETNDTMHDITSGASSVPWTAVFSFQAASHSPGCMYWNMGTSHTTTPTSAWHLLTGNGSSNYMSFAIRGPTGNSSASSATETSQDGTPHIMVVRNGSSYLNPNALEFWIDGVLKVATTNGNRSPIDVSGQPFNMGGKYSTYAGVEWKTDCFAVFDKMLPDDDVISLQAAYLAEI